jgi:hypothetical protein
MIAITFHVVLKVGGFYLNYKSESTKIKHCRFRPLMISIYSSAQSELQGRWVGSKYYRIQGLSVL